MSDTQRYVRVQWKGKASNASLRSLEDEGGGGGGLEGPMAPEGKGAGKIT